MSDDWIQDIQDDWTLFLDRDGVINQKLEGDYVKRIDEFAFIDGTIEALRLAAPIFKTIIVVTNQQGIGKGVMTEEELLGIHQYMLTEIVTKGGRIDRIYHCPGLAADNPPCRKPNTGMAYEAREDFPDIEFHKSVMVGDSQSDMEFGARLGMRCVRIGTSDPDHLTLPGLIHFVRRITPQ